MHAVDSTTNASSKLGPSFGYARLLNDLLASNLCIGVTGGLCELRASFRERGRSEEWPGESGMWLGTANSGGRRSPQASAGTRTSPRESARSDWFFALIGGRKGRSTSSAFRSQSVPKREIEPASRNPSAQVVPDPSATAMLVEGAAFDQCPEVLLERVAAGLGQLNGIADSHATMLAGKLDDL